ncbi:mechanosensitive ion channel family protein [Candidatus Nitrospira neomarina]|uniref:Mechanosensitive ion channel family protein n=1 Tax=Candidatus Nitrospira neomarina TaxID=3020899 RepID=A0AA96GNP5_9BACT|nr:mechanosensitive ion channel family protein [Candidatus Nitrospira neomarina]WNM63575.1 mechanosensitive ion channel family protein [Candidatus Nitrospira neomarina]
MNVRKRKQRVTTCMCQVLALVIGLCSAGLMLGGSAFGQPTLKEIVAGKEPSPNEEPVKDKSEDTEDSKLPIPDDPFGRGTPRGTVEGFLAAGKEGQYERAAEYLDFRYLPGGISQIRQPYLARQFQVVLDRALWIDPTDLSIDPTGQQEDGLPSYRDSVGHIEVGGQTIDILLQRIPREDGVFIWKFSNATVAQIPGLYREFGYGYLENFFPDAFFDLKILGIEIWLWVGLGTIVIVAYGVAYAVTSLIALVVRSRPSASRDQISRLLVGPGRFLLFLLIGRVMIGYINPPIWFQAVLQARTVMTIALVWTIFCMVDFMLDRLTQRFERQGKSSAVVILSPLGTGLKTLFVIIALLAWLDNMGFEVTTILAGLGIGGLAVALALQKPIENLISAITLYASQPVTVGDFCRFGDHTGTVEEIGLRATKVRTLDNTIITVPNVDFAQTQLENYSKRKKIWYHPQVRLRHETTPDQIRFILVEIRKLLYAHPKVLSDPARIRFQEFGAFSFNLEIFAYVDVTDYGEFLEVAEDLNLRIMDIVQKAGASFALPSQTLHMEKGRSPDTHLGEVAEAQVQEWREQQALYLPNFPLDKIAELRGTLEYPPPGSPVSATSS